MMSVYKEKHIHAHITTHQQICLEEFSYVILVCKFNRLNGDCRANVNVKLSADANASVCMHACSEALPARREGSSVMVGAVLRQVTGLVMAPRCERTFGFHVAC